MRAQPWMNRTRDQADANNFDLDLFRLISRAEQKAEAAVPRDRAKWRDIAHRLRTARSGVRQMMHADDVAETA